MSLQSALVVKQESNDKAIQSMDLKSDVTLAILTLEDVKPNLSTLISTSNVIKQNMSSQSSPLQGRTNETVSFSTTEDQHSDQTSSYSKDMKPNVSTEVLRCDVMKKDILTFSSFKGENKNSLDVQRQLEYLPDSDAFIENFTVVKSDLHHDLKELKELHKEVIDNFPTMYELRDKGLKTYKCDMCCQRFTHFYHITQHMKTHTRKNLYGYNFHQQQGAMKKKHKKLHPEDRCNECDHKKTHLHEKQYECYVCHKNFAQRYQLSRHQMTHSGLKPHECDVCHKKYSRKNHLLEHKKTHSDGPLGPPECDFVQRYQLSRHQMTHTGLRPHECDVCHKKYSRKDHLLEHKKIHSGSPLSLHECDVCHKKYANKSGLCFHKKSHSGLRPHECDVCHKNYTRKDELLEHKKTH
ncbi:zinc finger protein ZFP2-like [Physella acuta]|uniref:zinc finger protein ZFP2-like n=1 Tax=Physella acuta TaxID=109671 RepID=UPI0027DE9C36|nr:zinc finger protein ZFP2-like [Physella acuta]